MDYVGKAIGYSRAGSKITMLLLLSNLCATAAIVLRYAVAWTRSQFIATAIAAALLALAYLRRSASGIDNGVMALTCLNLASVCLYVL